MNDNGPLESPDGAPSAGGVPSGTSQPHCIRNRSRAGIGGTYSHKPGCQCYPCKARNREPKTLAIAAGVGGLALAPESAPVKKITAANGKKKAAPRSLRDRVAQYLHYSMTYPNETMKGLAEKMGIDRRYLHAIIRDGREAGILVFDDPLDRIEHEIVPKIVDNLNHFLDLKDRAVTIEAAKGTIFRSYQDAKGIVDGPQTILALKIEQPDGSDIKILTGNIVGRPKELTHSIINLEPTHES